MTCQALCPGCADTVALIADLETLTHANAFDANDALAALPHLIESALSCLLCDTDRDRPHAGTADAVRLLVAAAAQAQGLQAAARSYG